MTGIMLTGISDHCPVVLFGPPLKKSTQSKTMYWKRSLTNKNILALNSELAKVDWDRISVGNNVQDDYSQFITKLTELYDKCIPYKRMKASYRGPKHPWMTTGLLKSIRTKDRLYKKIFEKSVRVK